MKLSNPMKDLSYEDFQQYLPEGLISEQKILSSQERKLLLMNRILDLDCDYLHENHCSLAILSKAIRAVQKNWHLILCVQFLNTIYKYRSSEVKSKSQFGKEILKSTVRSLAFMWLYNFISKFCLCYVRKRLGTQGKLF